MTTRIRLRNIIVFITVLVQDTDPTMIQSNPTSSLVLNQAPQIQEKRHNPAKNKCYHHLISNEII